MLAQGQKMLLAGDYGECDLKGHGLGRVEKNRRKRGLSAPEE